MPKRGAVSAPGPLARTPERAMREAEERAELAKEADGKPVQLGDDPQEQEQEQPPEESKPARKGGKRSAPAEPEPDAAVEDWTRPAYADDPGEFEFDSLDDANEYYSVLWYGPEGTGKTTDVAMITQVEPKGRILLINAEAGVKRRALAYHGVDTSRISLYPKEGQDLTFEGLERLFYRLQADCEKDPDMWAAVGWDSITAIYQKLLDDVIEADIRKQAEILQRSGKPRSGRAGNITLRDRFETDRDDYASMSNQVRLLLRKYRTLPCHFLVTALERRDEDKKKNVTYGPAISPALSVDLLGYMDVVVRTKVLDTGTFYGRTQPTEDARGKDRLNGLPVELVDPTIERIHKYVTGELQEDEDRAQKRMPGGAEGVLRRRSLAAEHGLELPPEPPPHHTKDGTPDGPPLEGDEDDPPTPPKRGGRRTARSSTGAAASKAPAKSAEDESGSAPENSPKRGGRRTPRKTAAEIAAKEEVNGEGPKPATERAQKAAEAAKSGGFMDEPPF